MEALKNQIQCNIDNKTQSFKVVFPSYLRQVVLNYLIHCKLRGYDVADVTASTNLEQTHFVFISTGDPNSEMYFSIW